MSDDSAIVATVTGHTHGTITNLRISGVYDGLGLACDVTLNPNAPIDDRAHVIKTAIMHIRLAMRPIEGGL